MLSGHRNEEPVDMVLDIASRYIAGYGITS